MISNKGKGENACLLLVEPAMQEADSDRIQREQIITRSGIQQPQNMKMNV